VIQIRVGAALDSSVAAVFKQLPALARQAREQVDKELNRMGQSPYRDAPAHAKKNLDKIVDDTKEAANKGSEALIKMGDAAAKASRRAASSWREAYASMNAFARNSESNFRGVARAMAGVAGRVARGAGVNLDIGSLVGKNVALDKRVQDIANSGYLEGASGAAGVRQDPHAIKAEIRAAAAASATDTSDVAMGLHQFVAKSSDLETGRAVLADMAKLAKATGSNMVDVADAAGDVSNKLGDVPNKAEAVRSAMLIIAQQGKLGAVEMRQMAKQIAVMVGPANQFAEGTAAATSELGAAFQMTKKFGGVKGPAQAATSVANFVNDLSSKAGRKNLLAGGLKDSDIYADKGHTKINNLADIISKALEKTGGDLTKMGGMFTNKRSAAVVKAFQEVYTQAEKVQKGSGGAAVRAKFGEFGAAMSSKDMSEALAGAMGTSASKVELFNQKLEVIAERLADRLLPALDKMAPDVLKLADAAGELAGFISEHLGAAIVAAAVGSIAKAALGQAVSSMIKGALSGGGVGGGPLGAGGAIGGAAIAGAAIGVGAVLYGARSNDVAVDKAGASQDETEAILERERKARGGGRGRDAAARAHAAEVEGVGANIISLTQRIRDAERSQGLSGLTNLLHGEMSLSEIKQGSKDYAHLDELKASLAQQQALLKSITTATLKVEVVNQPAGAPGVNNGARTNIAGD
jgi:hypothetical protein